MAGVIAAPSKPFKRARSHRPARCGNPAKRVRTRPLGRRQVVRQRFLVPPFLGSNPSAPATFARTSGQFISTRPVIRVFEDSWHRCRECPSVNPPRDEQATTPPAPKCRIGRTCSSSNGRELMAICRRFDARKARCSARFRCTSNALDLERCQMQSQGVAIRGLGLSPSAEPCAPTARVES